MKHQSIPGRLLAGALSLVLAGALSGPALAAAPKTVTLGIYSTDHMAGRSYSLNPLDGSPEENGYLKVASAVARERAAVDDLLLIDGGNAMPTGLPAGYAGDGGASVALALRAIGYNVLVPGRGEFAFAPAVRSSFFQSLAAPGDGSGTPVSVLTANFLRPQTQAPRFSPYQVYTLGSGDLQLRVGVLGLSGMDLAREVPSSYLEGGALSHRENKAGTCAWEWSSYWQQTLQASCDFVVVVCQESGEALRAFAAETTGIDLIIAAGGSAGTFTLPNGAGQPVPCVGGGGEALTKTTLTVAAGGSSVTVSQTALLPLSDYPDDPALATRLRDAYSRLEGYLDQGVGTLSGGWADTDNSAADLVGQAMVWASGAEVALVSAAYLGDLQPAAFFSGGGAAASIAPRDCWSLYPYVDSRLYTVKLTGKQVKALLEDGARSYRITADKTVAGGETADLLYGADYELYLGNPAGRQVMNLTVGGKPVDDSQILRVAVEAGRLEAGGLSLSSGALVWSGTTSRAWSASGGSVSAILAGYLKEQTAQTGYVAPAREVHRTVYAGPSDGAVTRLEFVSMLYELAGRPTPNADTAFLDVADNSAVVWAAERGISSGDGKGNFFPAQPVTREQAAVMIYNFSKTLGLKTPAGSALSSSLLDYGEISAWARPAVTLCYRTGVLSGAGRGDLFLPKEPLTRDGARAAVANFESLLRAGTR